MRCDASRGRKSKAGEGESKATQLYTPLGPWLKNRARDVDNYVRTEITV